MLIVFVCVYNSIEANSFVIDRDTRSTTTSVDATVCAPVVSEKLLLFKNIFFSVFLL